MIAALIGNSLIAVAKFVVGFLTSSAAMIAEAFHSVADSGNQVLLVARHQRVAKGRPPSVTPSDAAKRSTSGA